MRILHVTPSYAPAYRFGGPVRSLEGLVPALMSLGVEVRVVTTDVAGPGRLDVPRGWVERGGAAVRYFSSWTDRDFAPSMLGALGTEVAWADVVHVTGVFCSTSLFGVLAARRSNRPVVLSPRGALEAGSLAQRATRKRIALALARPALDAVTLFHATSDKEQASIERLVGSDRARVVPNGVHLPVVRAVTRSGPAVVAALGRIHPSKGYLELVRAVALLRERGLDVHLRIAGPEQDPVYMRALRDEAQRRGIAPFVALVGALDGKFKEAFLAEARLLVMPSHDTENFGNAVVEALASGRPVVASTHTPWASLESHDCGRHVPNTPEALAEAITPYVTDADLAEAAGRRGRAFVEREFAWPRVARRMLGLYEEARARGSRP